MAAGDAPGRKPRAAQRTVLPERPDRILGAAGLEPARPAEPRRERPLVDPYHQHQQPTHRWAPALLARVPSACATSCVPNVAAACRAITTRSIPSRSSEVLASRNHSRTRRFTRFLTTAFPTRRLTVSPSLPAPPSGRSTTTTTKPGPAPRRPRRAARRNSQDRRRRCPRRRHRAPRPTATCWESRRRGASGPSPDGASARHDPLGCACGSESRGRACGRSGWVGTSVSWPGPLPSCGAHRDEGVGRVGATAVGGAPPIRARQLSGSPRHPPTKPAPHPSACARPRFATPTEPPP